MFLPAFDKTFQIVFGGRQFAGVVVAFGHWRRDIVACVRRHFTYNCGLSDAVAINASTIAIGCDTANAVAAVAVAANAVAGVFVTVANGRTVGRFTRDRIRHGNVDNCATVEAAAAIAGAHIAGRAALPSHLRDANTQNAEHTSERTPHRK